MITPIIRVDNLSKKYRLGQVHKKLLSERLGDGLCRLLGSNPDTTSQEDFWALRDVSFEINQGDVVGIIGRNGAGKSTLLKILSRITAPTTGRVEMFGRVASLLEVGTGFHPELTGRENVFLNGVILGMSKDEIKRKFDEIVAFAEIEKFLDTPVKRYSSGMYVRLAFSVAAHLESEILVVDEVLAVGDAEFQKKCLGKMHDVAAHHGRTVLFVSHNMAAVQALCGRAVYLHAGRVEGVGEVDQQIGIYLRGSRAAGEHPARQVFELGDTVELRGLNLRLNPSTTGEPVEFEFTLSSLRPIRLKEIALLIYSIYGMRIAVLDLRKAGLASVRLGTRPLAVKGRIDSIPLVEGDYRVGFYIRTDAIKQDSLDLATLTVTSPASVSEHLPYQAAHRGVLELKFSLKANFIETV